MCLPRSRPAPTPPPPPVVEEPTKQEIYDSTPHQVDKVKKSSTTSKKKGKASLRTDLSIGAGNASGAGLNVG
tara:strand:- start:851 stop:1066 length:216 start_codon:yes stop_codon:yes gene_type:complete